MDAMLSETKDDGRPIAYDKVAGVVVTGNEDGAHHCIAEISGALNDIGYTLAGQGWTYWNKGPGPGDQGIPQLKRHRLVKPHRRYRRAKRPSGCRSTQDAPDASAPDRTDVAPPAARS